MDDRVETSQDLGGGSDADIVLGEINAGFEERDKFQQLRLDRSKPPGDRPRRCCAAIRA